MPLADATSSLPANGVVDFYRMNFDAQQQAWPCEKSFCRVEYLVQVQQAGAYQAALHYSKTNEQCMGVAFALEDEQVDVFKLDQAATLTAPVTLQLPCGISRNSIRDPNYVDGEFCSYGARFGNVDLKRLP